MKYRLLTVFMMIDKSQIMYENTKNAYDTNEYVLPDVPIPITNSSKQDALRLSILRRVRYSTLTNKYVSYQTAH